MSISKDELSRIRLMAFDFDGVFTDNCVYVDQDGRESVRCWRSDGIGLSALRELGIGLVVISKEKNGVVQARCRKLGIECRSGIDDKLSTLKDIASGKGVRLSECGFMGNDTPDIPCMEAVGFPVAVKGSHPEALAASKYVTKTEGGRGAVREVCDLIASARKE